MSYEIVKSIVIKNDKVFSRIESNNVYPKSFISEENPGLTKILNEDGKAELLVKLVEGGLDGYLRFQKNGNKLVKELEGITNKLWEDEKCKKLKSNVYSLEYKLWDFKEENNEENIEKPEKKSTKKKTTTETKKSTTKGTKTKEENKTKKTNSTRKTTATKTSKKKAEEK